MIVYLLIVIAVKNPTFGSKVIDINTMVFQESAQCIRNAEYNKKRLILQYDEVNANCVERKIEK